MLLVLSYTALLFNGSATVTSLTLTDRLGELTFRSSREPHLQPESEDPDQFTGGPGRLLQRYNYKVYLGIGRFGIVSIDYMFP